MIVNRHTFLKWAPQSDSTLEVAKRERNNDTQSPTVSQRTWYKKGIVYTCIRWLLHTIVKLLKHNKKSDTKKKNSSKIKELTKKKN